MPRAKLGEILMQRGVIDAATLKRALGEQLRFAGQKIKIGQLLVDMRVCTWEQVCQALAEQLAIPYASLDEADDNTIKLVPLEVCEKWRAVAFHRELGPPEQVCVAFEEPGDLVAVDALRLRVGKRVKVYLCAPDKLKALLDRVFRGIESGGDEGLTLEAELFGADGEEVPMAVEHYEAGALAMEQFGDAPAPAAPPPAMSLGTADALDSLMGGPAQPEVAGAGEPTASVAAGLGDPFAGLGLDAPPPAERNVSPPVANTAKVPVTHFPDKRTKEPAAPPPKPTLVLTSDALFAAPAAPVEPLEADDLLVEVLSGESIEVAEAEPSEPLFGTHFDASEEAGAEQVGAVEAALAPLPEPELEAPAEEVDLEEVALEARPPTVPPQPIQPEPIEFEDLPTSIDPAPPKVEAPPPSPAVAEAAPAPPPHVAHSLAPSSPPANLDDSLASFADRPLTSEELDIIGAIEQLADGAIEASPVKQTKPAHMIAALVRLLIRRGIIQETEFLAELSRK